MAIVSVTKTLTANISWDSAWAMRENSGAGILWSISPSSMVSIDDPYAEETTVLFRSAGTYTVTCTVSDGAMKCSDTKQIVISEGAASEVPVGTEDVTITQEVQIPIGAQVYQEVDLMLITDCSGSMSSMINGYKTQLTSLLNEVRNVANSVYCGNIGYESPAIDHYCKLVDVGTSYGLSTLQTAVNGMYDRGGQEPLGAAITYALSNAGYRSQSLPMMLLGSSDWDTTGETYTSSALITALKAKSVKAYSIGSTTSGKMGPDIAAGSGGASYSFNGSNAALLSAIQNAVEDASTNITVQLVGDSNAPAGLIKKITPEYITNVSPGDPSFSFDITFAGGYLSPGETKTYTFELQVIAENVAVVDTVPIEITVSIPMPVTGTSGVTRTIYGSKQLDLSGVTVTPSNASNTTIIWSVDDTGTADARMYGNILVANNYGTCRIKATVKNGVATGTSYEEYFDVDFIMA